MELWSRVGRIVVLPPTVRDVGGRDAGGAGRSVLSTPAHHSPGCRAMGPRSAVWQGFFPKGLEVPRGILHTVALDLLCGG